MTDSKFLASVARYHADKGVFGGTDKKPLVYVVPNKRGAMFLKRYVCNNIEVVAFMPRFMTMRNFVSLRCPLPEADARESLFILYKAYLAVMDQRQRPALPFDAFVFWGNMLLDDFDDIDLSLVNANEIFKNLKNFKEIQANYLNEDQKEVIRRVWGESRITAESTDFWAHISHDKKTVGSEFVSLWEILADVYNKFKQMMNQRGVASRGREYLDALDFINSGKEEDEDAVYAFVGFNDLTTVETLIFDKLKKMGKAEFFWDTAALRLLPAEGAEVAPRPLRRLRELMQHFPAPKDYVCPVPSHRVKINVYSSPSNVGQAKALKPILDKWIERKYMDPADAINTAVVMPDPNILLPSLLSLPDKISKLNISMGLSYRSTTFATLLSAIISMQLRARTIRNEIHYFYEDINAVLTHPHIQQIAREQADKAMDQILRTKMYNIPVSMFASEDLKKLSAVFQAVQNSKSVDDVADYLINLLDWLEDGLEADGGEVPKFETTAIQHFRKEIEDLRHLTHRYDVQMSERTFFHMFERIFGQQGLTLNGTPLAGLQMLGVLETRLLDFENVVFMSLNERVFPRRQYTKTMISSSLRHAFGLSDFESLEWTYAYCFYRLISRAEHVAIVYDSRAEAPGHGELSRYAAQLRHMMANVDVHIAGLLPSSDPRPVGKIVVNKTEEIQEALNQFRAGGKLRLSASALKTYKKCSLAFYLQYVRRMRSSDEVVDYMTSSEFGNIVHRSIQNLFKPYENKVISKAVYDKWLDEPMTEVKSVVRQAFFAERYPGKTIDPNVPLNVQDRINEDVVLKVVVANLEAERDTYCKDNKVFTFIKNEMEVDDAWKINDDLTVRFYMSIDRVDKEGDKYRFVDFKTGKDKTSVSGLDNVFQRKHNDYEGIFQLFLYSAAYRAIKNAHVSIQPIIHAVPEILTTREIADIALNKVPVEDFKNIEKEVLPYITGLISEIFNPDEPFKQCTDTASCRFCNFVEMCGRTIPDY